MATEPEELTKTPSEIYLLASRTEQVTEAAKLLEFALREYTGDYRLGFTELYNANRKIFEKELRDRIRPAFEVRSRLRNVAKHGEPEFEAKTEAAEAFIDASQFLFSKYRKLYPEKFWPPATPAVQDSAFFEKGFQEPSPDQASSFDKVRSRSAEEERVAIRRQDAPSSSTGTELAPESAEDEDKFEIPTYQLAGPGGLFPPKLKITQLEKICNRLGRSLKAGIPIARSWESESRSFSGKIGESFQEVLTDISAGETLAQSISKHECFPPMMCEMVRVGEETGRLDRVFLRLSDHYRNLVQMRRTFISGVTWPIFQFAAAIGVISLFFIVLAVLETMMSNFAAPDIFLLGLGPIGNLVLFWTLLGVFGVAAFVGFKGIANGWFGQTPMKLALGIPLIGNTIRILCLSRMAWSFGMAIESGMDAQRAIQLGLRSTDNHFYISHEQEVMKSVADGNDFYTALHRTDAFPEDFLQAVEVGEMTGEITESLERLSDDYKEQAEILLRRISQVFGFLVSLFVMGIVVLLIVLMYMNYLGTINEALSNSSGALERIQSGEKTSNPYTAAADSMVKKIVESEDMQNITKMYEAAAKADELHGHDFLDALLEPFEKKK